MATARIGCVSDDRCSKGLKCGPGVRRAGTEDLERGRKGPCVTCYARSSDLIQFAPTGIGEPVTLKLGLAVHSFPGERPVLLVHGSTRSAQFATWISQPGLDRDQILLLIEALVAKPFDPGVDLPTGPDAARRGNRGRPCRPTWD